MLSSGESGFDHGKPTIQLTLKLHVITSGVIERSVRGCRPMRLLQVPDRRVVPALVLLVLFTASPFVFAAPVPGRAEVRAIKGAAIYMTNGGPARPLKEGTIIRSGSTIKTGSNSTVDLYLGVSAGVLRVGENSTVTLDKFTLEDTGADTAVDVQVHVPNGDIYFNVNKLSKASRYEVKMPNGIAGIRGTKGCFSFRPSGGPRPPIVLLTGGVVFIHAPPGGRVTPYAMNAPPAVYFSAIGGVQIAPAALAESVSREVEAATRKATPLTVPPPSLNKQTIEPFVSPGIGTQAK